MQLELAPDGVIDDENEQGRPTQLGEVLSNDPAVQVIVSHVYPARLCVHVKPLFTLKPSAQLDVAPDGVIDDEYVHGRPVHTGAALSNDPAVQTIEAQVYPACVCVQVVPLTTLAPSAQLEAAPDGVNAEL